jgi:tetratricopeptide (TPR) repeat protein
MSSDLGTPYAGARIDEPATRSPACPACGRHSQPESAFCAFCGTALVHQRVPGPPVFAAVATAIDGRSAYEVLSEVGELFESLGAVFEGVSQSPATLVALFPPREDAAVVASRAALEATERCPEARFGIDASEVTEHSDQDAIWQDLIDRSAHLGSVAEPGTIAASEAILPLSEGAAVVEPIDGVTGATRLRELRDLAAPPEVMSLVAEEPAPGAPTAFVGRERELAELRSRFDVVRDQGGAACVAIVGEPGIGTSRLAREFAASLGDAKVFSLPCTRELDGGAWPLAELVEAFAGLTPWDDPGTTRAKLERLLTDVPRPDRALERIAHLVAIDGGVAVTDETRWAVRELIEAALLGPSVLVVDDVDRAAFGFAAFLSDLARALRSTPLLVVCTAATEPAGISDSIVLSSLDDAASRAIVASRLGRVDPDATTAIVTSFEGSPLLLEQGIAMLLETAAVTRVDDGWIAAGDLSTRGAASAREAIAERLRALPADVRATAGLATWAGAILAPGALEGEDATGHLATLAAMQLLVPLDDGTMGWSHPTIRETAAADDVPSAATASLLRRLSRQELLDAGPRRWRHAASAGSRMAEAVRLAGDAASDDDRADALELLLFAAGSAAQHGDAAGASILERRAALLLPASDARRAELMFLAAMHEAATGRIAETEAAINDAIAATIRVPGDTVDHHVRILRAGLRAAADRSALDAARAIADEAYERFTELDDAWGRSRAAALRGQVHAARGHAAATFEDLLEAAALARAAQRPADAAAALRGAGRALLDGPMPVEEAIALCERLRADATGHPLAEHDLAGVHAVLLARRGRTDQAHELIATTIAVVEELGADADLAVALHRSGVIFWLAGEFEAAEPPIQRALAAAALARDDRLRARIASSWANLVLATEDRIEEAMALADVAETWATDPAALVGWRTARARALVRLGDAETADRLGRQAVSLAEQTDSTDLRANALLHLAEVLQRAGRPAEAVPFQRRALRILDRKGATAQAATLFRQIAPTTSELITDAAKIGPEVLAADDDLEPEPPQQLEPLARAERTGEPTSPADETRSETDAREDPAPPVDDLALDQPAGTVPTPDPAEPSPERPIAESFAASSDADKRKRGLFRR